MTAYIIRRLGISVITLIAVITLIFILVRLAPGDPATILLGDFYTGEAAAELRAKWGLDKTLIIQYFRYLYNILKGDFGHSYVTGKPVFQQLLVGLPHTFYLAIGSMTFSLIIGVPSGIMAALNRNRWIDMVTISSASMLMAIPGFYLGVILILFFSLKLGIFPALGTGQGNFVQLLWYLVLPSISLGGPSAAITARMTRSSMLEVIGEDYVRTAWAKGLQKKTVILKHVLRNAMIPVLATTGMSFAHRFGGAAVIEILFQRRGIGSLLVNSIYDRDYMQVQLGVLFFALALILVNLLIDLSYSFLDPRIRYD